MVEGTGARARHAAVERLRHVVPVNGVGHGAPDPQVVEGRSAQVELEVVERPERRIARGAHPEAGIRRHSWHVAEAHGAERVVVDLAFLQREHAHRRLLDDPEHDAVEIRPFLDEEVVVALEDQVPAAHPLAEPERAGADRRGVHGMGLGIPAVAVDMLRDDRHQGCHQRLHERRVRPAQPDDGGERVRGVDARDRVEHGDAERVVLPDDAEREGDVFGGDGAAVVEAGAGDEVEGVDETVRGDRPALGQVGPGFEAVADPDQAGEELGARHARIAAGLHGGVEVTGIAAPADDQGAARHGLGRQGGTGERGGEAEDRRTGER